MSSLQKPPLVHEPVSLGEKSQKNSKSGHAVHKAGTQSYAEQEEAEKSSTGGTSQSHKAPHTLPQQAA
jgi:hypothetical protein